MNPEAARWLPREKRGWYFALRRLQGEEALVYFCPHAAASSVYSLHPPGGLFRTLPLPMVRRQGQNLLFCDPRGRPRLRCSLPPPRRGLGEGLRDR